MYTWSMHHIEEMLQIKSLGFNTLIHYNRYPSGGNIGQTMGACVTTGMMIILYSDRGDTENVKYDHLSEVVGYMLFDEPAQHGVSVSNQQARIDMHRAVTKKDLCVVDSGDFGAGVRVWAADYDVFFQDTYATTDSDYYSNKRVAILVGAQIRWNCPKSVIIPCLGLFTNTQYSNEVETIKLAENFYHTSKDGGFAAFAWDCTDESSNFTGDIKTNTGYQTLASSLTTKYSKVYDFDYYLFAPADKTSTEPMSGAVTVCNLTYSNNARPFSVLDVGAATDERHSTFADKGFAFIGYNSLLALNITTKGCLVTRLEYTNHINSDYAIISECLFDDDYFNVSRELQTKQLNSNQSMVGVYNTALNMSYGLKIQSPTSTSLYWKFIDGFVINSNWVD